MTEVDRKNIPPIAPADLHAGCRVVGLSDVGRVREENQDFMGYFRHGANMLLVVADGMGGHSGGFEASRIAVDILGNTFGMADASEDPREILKTGIQRANQAVRQVASNNPVLQGMGTTIVAAIIADGRAWIAHVGDSRIYLLRAGECALLTLDHSRVFRMVEEGMISLDQVDEHPMGHVLERSVGAADVVDVTVREKSVPLQKGDRLILCTDGVTGMVKDEELPGLFDVQKPLFEAAQMAIGLALQRGADDNTTVGVLEVVEGPDGVADVLDVRAAFQAGQLKRANAVRTDTVEVTNPIPQTFVAQPPVAGLPRWVWPTAAVLALIVIVGLVRVFGSAEPVQEQAGPGEPVASESETVGADAVDPNADYQQRIDHWSKKLVDRLKDSPDKHYRWIYRGQFGTSGGGRSVFQSNPNSGIGLAKVFVLHEQKDAFLNNHPSPVPKDFDDPGYTCKTVRVINEQFGKGKLALDTDPAAAVAYGLCLASERAEHPVLECDQYEEKKEDYFAPVEFGFACDDFDSDAGKRAASTGLKLLVEGLPLNGTGKKITRPRTGGSATGRASSSPPPLPTELQSNPPPSVGAPTVATPSPSSTPSPAETEPSAERPPKGKGWAVFRRDSESDVEESAPEETVSGAED